ncbi:tRNA threonylcarbamoyladenosine biosynthesis protein sua5 [Tetrabaena socialis]|uniref:Threonylcarbamoyl-AMP synthase n=1 Tax=Tetrabaena socialis TaxID=47790 RepID=A0A2J8ADH3_9CHLO|nr:tRNA threonylcarbamoyladenosine biosynthesis protein sua5 [Tetrabaena socialis]|eukprot:PNH10570.1 tRNA threonylcarbamoyladenosine biosynthesis protein sua5 [Tetrabaena socialis]
MEAEPLGARAAASALATHTIEIDMVELRRRGGEASTSGRRDADAGIARAAAALAAGDVVAIPTETVYGLAANALSASAVGKVYAAKGRPADNPLIIHISSLAMLASLYPAGWSLPPVYEAVVKDLWPGPLTILLPRSALVSDAVTCGLPTMAVRMPAHPVALALIAACGFPLAAPSANSSGRPSPTLARHVLADLGGRIPLILDGGPCTCGVESTVLDALRSPPAILRPGGVTSEQLLPYPGLEGLQVYRRDFVDEALEAAPSTPGMKYRHYSPVAPVWLLDPGAAPAAGSGGAAGAARGAGAAGAGADADELLAARLQRGVAALLAELAAADAAVAAELSGAAAASAGRGAEAAASGGLAPAAAVAAGLAPGHASEEQQQQAGAGRAGGRVGVLRTSMEGLQPGPQAEPAQEPVAARPGAQALGPHAPAHGEAPAHQRAAPHLEYVLAHVSQPAEVASQLFAGLRYMDEQGVATIVVEGLRDEGVGAAVMNRLRKAASRVVPV